MTEHQPEPNPDRDQETQRHESEHQPDVPPMIWVASLADYVNGRLHGAWIDPAVDDDELHSSVQAMLQRSSEPNAEEHAIFDFEGFNPWQPGEYTPLELVAKVARGIRDHGTPYAVWTDLVSGDLEQLDQFTDAYFGHYESPEAWAEEMATDLGLEADLDKAIPATWRPYVRVDYEGLARDCRLSGDVTFEERPDGSVDVFREGL
jgi:antirestriction protein